MDFTQLRYFQVLARLEHSTRAAAELHIAQPALSRSIRGLEDALGLELFDRVGKRLRLNDNGRILLRHADTILQEIEDAKKELQDQRTRVNRHVSISMSAASKLLPGLIRGFKARYPDVTLEIKQQDPEGEFPGNCDIMISSSICPVEKANTITLMEEEICLAMPVSNPFSGHKKIRLQEVAEEPFICLFKGKSLRRVTDEYCRMAGFVPEIILESDSPGTVRELIALGVGLAFIPKITWQGMESDPNISLVEIEEPHCTRFINMTWQNNHYASKSSALLQNYLVEFFSDVSADYQRRQLAVKAQ